MNPPVCAVWKAGSMSGRTHDQNSPATHFEPHGALRRGSKPKPAKFIRLLKTAKSSGTPMRHMDGRMSPPVGVVATSNRKPPVRNLVPRGTPCSCINLGCPRRSEDHTSELQSRQYLVCRLL